MEKDAQAPDMGKTWALAIGGFTAVAAANAVGVVRNAIVRPEFILQPLFAVQLLLAFGGLLVVGIAVKMRPTRIPLLLLACAACAVGWFGIPREWDSMRLVAGFGAIVSALGAALVAMPTNYRKIAVSVLMLVHFGGIVTAVTSPPTQPWLSNVLGIAFYRPYLQFMYLVNAYHFYSPEPGPASQLWFCIKYKPDENNVVSVRWFKMPRRPEDMTDPLALSYYRRLSLTQQIENVAPAIVTDEQKAARVMARGPESATEEDTTIPIHPEIMPVDLQFRMPPENVREHLLPSYVRHVANMKENQHDDGMTQIDTIKVYRVEHYILLPVDWKYGFQPYDETTYRPYYLGEFDKEGHLTNPADPLLYWLVPILRLPKPNTNVQPWDTPRTRPDGFIILDSVKRHTGSDHNLTRKGKP